jgi:hypothetical protein
MERAADIVLEAVIDLAVFVLVLALCAGGGHRKCEDHDHADHQEAAR